MLIPASVNSRPVLTILSSIKSCFALAYRPDHFLSNASIIHFICLILYFFDSWTFSWLQLNYLKLFYLFNFFRTEYTNAKSKANYFPLLRQDSLMYWTNSHPVNGIGTFVALCGHYTNALRWLFPQWWVCWLLLTWILEILGLWSLSLCLIISVFFA